MCLSTVTSQRLVLKQEEGEVEAYAVRKVRPTYTVLCILSICIFYLSTELMLKLLILCGKMGVRLWDEYKKNHFISIVRDKLLVMI